MLIMQEDQFTHHDYQMLCEQIWEHNKRYYADHQPTISDEEYDFMFKKLEEMERHHPEWVDSSSPTQRVNESLTSGFKTVAHRIPMLSLANTYSKEELSDFIQRMKKLTQRENINYSCELKMDGIAISVIYERGVLVRGVTRGDGKSGDDITQNIRSIESLPSKLQGDDVPDYLEIRGEVFMKHQVFHELNAQRKVAEDPLWANPRNAAAGSLKLLDSQEAAKRKLSAVFYGVAEGAPIYVTSQFESHAFLRSLGLPILEYLQKCGTLDEIWTFAEKVRSVRTTLPFDIDGIVVKLDDLREQKRLGNTGKNIRWAIAYKFAAERAATRIKDITVQVGRTGVLTPVAELEPVLLAGSTISRATLHNQEEIQRKDIRIGDLAYIEKGGDVIPKVVGIEISERPSNSEVWEMPKICPSCGASVAKVAGEVAVRCLNPQCYEQQLKRLIYFAGKDAMDIDNLGEKVVEQLFRRGFVKRPSDIYRLTEIELSQLEGFKAKSIDNLMTSIAKSKEVSLARFIMALGIKYVGTGTSELLANKAGDIHSLIKMSSDELLKIEGVGEKVANAVAEYFLDQESLEEISRLLQAGVNPKAQEVICYEEHAFNGKTFVLTGTLPTYTRQAAATLIKERGGKVTDSVSKKTDYLLTGEDPGSKIEKAKTLGVKILSEPDFVSML